MTARLSTRINGSVTIIFQEYSQSARHNQPTYSQEGIEGGNEETALLIVPEESPEEVWNTLEEPSGKFDLFIKYNAPTLAGVPIEEIVATGWGDQSNDDDDDDPFTIIKIISS